MSSSSHNHGSGGASGTRCLSMRELMDLPFDQLAAGVAAAGTTPGSGLTSRSAVSLPPLAPPRARSSSAVSAGAAGGMSSGVWPPLEDALHWISGHHRESNNMPGAVHLQRALFGLPLDYEGLVIAGPIRQGPRYSRPYTPGSGTAPYDYEALLALDEGRMVRAVQPEVVRGLPTRPAQRSDASNSCHICLERPSPGSTLLTTLPCTHTFCASCIRPWLSEHNTCPVCRWAFPGGQTHLVSQSRGA